jgi:hypothetical protein
MKLEDLKMELDSQARNDLKIMEKELFNLKAELEIRRKECLSLRDKNEELTRQTRHLPPITIIPTEEKVADVIFKLSNRCYGQTKGLLCCFCDIQDFCRVTDVQRLRILLDRVGMPGPENL